MDYFTSGEKTPLLQNVDRNSIPSNNNNPKKISFNEKEHPLDSKSLFIKLYSLLTHSWLLPLIKYCYADNITGDGDEQNYAYSLPEREKIDNLNTKWRYYIDAMYDKNKTISCWHIIWAIDKYNIIFTMFWAAGEATLHTTIIWFWTYYWGFISDPNAPVSSGFRIIFLIYLLLIIKVTCMNLSYFSALRIALRTTSALIYNCYIKAMKVNINTPSEESLNLIGSSMQSIILCIYWLLQKLVYVLTLLILLFATIYIKIGSASIIGILFMIFVGLFCQLLIAYLIAKIDKIRLKIGDKRVSFMNELFLSIRILKVNAWESPFIKKISDLRLNELKQIKKRTILYGVAILCNVVVPTITILIILLIYVYIFDNQLDSSITVFLLSVLSLMSISMRYLPICLSYTSELIVNIQRVNAFLSCKEKETPSIQYKNNNNNDNDNILDQYVVNIDNISFKWSKNAQFTLKDISLKINSGELVAVIGKVGSGKTSLIQCMLKEMDVDMNSINDNSSYYINNQNTISYISQSPMIFNLTLRENIILDLEYDKDKYNAVLHASCLIPDLKRVPNGDLTEIGEKGVNISGGQKMRIQFARALYRNSILNNDQLFLFDDPFSSVDVYIGKQMFQNGVVNYLNNRTRVIVINSQLNLLEFFDKIYVMNNGVITFNGSFKELLEEQKQNQYINDLLSGAGLDEIDTKTDAKTFLLDDDDKKTFDEYIDNTKGHLTSQAKVKNNIIPSRDVWNKYFTNWSYNLKDYDYSSNFLKCDVNDINWLNSKKMNVFYLVIITFMFILAVLSQSMLPLCDIWMLFWSEDAFGHSTNWYLFIWIVLLFCIAVLSMFAVYLLAISSVNGSYHIFMTTLMYTLRRYTLFFDITPKGRLLNRFSADTQAMDKELPYNIIRCISYTCTIIGYFSFIIIIFPTSLIVFLTALPLFIVFYIAYFKSYLLATRLRKMKLSPIMSLFNETLTGLDTIRSYNLQLYLRNKMKTKINNYCAWYFYQRSIAIWGALWTDFNVSTISVTIMIITIYFKDSYDPNLLAICVWYLFVLGTNMQPQAWTFMRIQRDLTSVDRLFELQNTSDPSIYEYKQINKSYNLNKSELENWPKTQNGNGEICLNNLKLRYRKSLNVSLFIDNLLIKNGEKIGICGRTGSGKSSILNAVFRLFECDNGSELTIDNIDCFKLGLYDLRNSLCIITQDPILFSGTLRFNLDPFNKYNDNDIWMILKKVGLYDLISQKPEKLNCVVNSFGSNYSEGQKQLICFARILLKKPKIIFMDEATSNIDNHTDAKILNILLTDDNMKNITIICIAHRLQTIINNSYNKVIVMADGKIVQNDTPANLIKSREGPFYQLTKDINQQFVITST